MDKIDFKSQKISMKHKNIREDNIERVQAYPELIILLQKTYSDLFTQSTSGICY